MATTKSVDTQASSGTTEQYGQVDKILIYRKVSLAITATRTGGY